MGSIKHVLPSRQHTMFNEILVYDRGSQLSTHVRYGKPSPYRENWSLSIHFGIPYYGSSFTTYGKIGSLDYDCGLLLLWFTFWQGPLFTSFPGHRINIQSLDKRHLKPKSKPNSLQRRAYLNVHSWVRGVSAPGLVDAHDCEYFFLWYLMTLDRSTSSEGEGDMLYGRLLCPRWFRAPSRGGCAAVSLNSVSLDSGGGGN